MTQKSRQALEHSPTKEINIKDFNINTQKYEKKL